MRNESFVALYGVIGLWAILRYLETGRARYTYWLVVVSGDAFYYQRDGVYLHSRDADFSGVGLDLPAGDEAVERCQ